MIQNVEAVLRISAVYFGVKHGKNDHAVQVG